MLRHQQVFDHRHFTEQPHVLEGAHHAHAGDGLPRQSFRVAIAQFDGAAGRAVKPVRQLNTVVLPAPLGPISDTISPSFSVNATLLTASSPPKRIDRPSTCSKG